MFEKKSSCGIFAEFALTEDDSLVAVYTCCNLHGLRKSESFPAPLRDGGGSYGIKPTGCHGSVMACWFLCLKPAETPLQKFADKLYGR